MDEKKPKTPKTRAAPKVALDIEHFVRVRRVTARKWNGYHPTTRIHLYKPAPGIEFTFTWGGGGIQAVIPDSEAAELANALAILLAKP